jgi:hypothetical protein
MTGLLKSKKFLIPTISIIVIIAGGISGVFIFQSAVQSGIDKTDILIESIEVTDSTETSLEFIVYGSLDGPQIDKVTIKSMLFNISYESILTKEVSLLEEDIIMDGNNLSMVILLDNLEESVVSEILYNFVQEEELTFTMTGEFQITANGILGALETTAQISKELKLKGFGGLEVSFDQMIFHNASTEKLIFNVTVSFENPSVIEAEVDESLVELYYNSTYVGYSLLPEFTVTQGLNAIEAQAVIEPEDREQTGVLLGEMFGNQSIEIEVVTNFTVLNSEGDPGFTVPFSSEIIVPPQGYSFIKGVSIDDISITINALPTPSVSFTIDCSSTIANPTFVDVNVTNMVFDMFFDDPDGASFLLLSYSAKNNIYIDTFEKDYPTPLELIFGQEYILNFTFSSTNLELGIRLDDEYSGNQLYVDIRNAVLTIDVLGFSLVIPFEIENIFVPY